MKSLTSKSAAEQGNAEMVAVVGGMIIDGNGGTPINDGVILIEGKRIRAIGDRSIPIPPQAKQIQVTGKFVIPGLMCSTVYLVDATWVPEAIRHEGRYDEVAIEAAQLALKGGVTTIFDTWGPRDPLIKARNAINEGRATGARIYLCGNWISLGGPYSSDMRLHFKEPVGEPFAARINALFEVNVGEALLRMPVEDVRQEVRKYIQSGVDFVQYPLNTHQAGALHFIALSPRVQRMIVEEAHRAGLPVQAYFVTTEEGIHVALDAGVDMMVPFAHGGRPTSVETLEAIVQKGATVNMQVFPTDDLEWYRQPPPGGHSANTAVAMFETAEVDQRALIHAGVPLMATAYSGVFSADQIKDWSRYAAPGAYGAQALLGEAHVKGLRALQQKGMTPMDALMTHTRNVARAYKKDKDIGTLERGKLADLVVLDKNPLEDPQHYRSIHLVMKEGEAIDREALPTQRLWTASAVGSN